MCEKGRCCATRSAGASQVEPMSLKGRHDEALTRPLPHDELVQLQCSLKKRGSLMIWLDKEMTWHAPHEDRPGQPTVFSDAAIQFCLTIKVLFKLPLRQMTGMVASLLRMENLDWPAPDYSAPCRRQTALAVQLPYARSCGLVCWLCLRSGVGRCGPCGHPRRTRLPGVRLGRREGRSWRRSAHLKVVGPTGQAERDCHRRCWE